MPAGTRRRSTAHTIALAAMAGMSLALGVQAGGAGASPAAQPAAAKPGGLIAFSSNRVNNYDIYTASTPGAVPLNLTNNGAPTSDYDPAWSPNGRQIIFTSEGPSTGNNEDIWIMNADGSGQRPLITGAGSDESNAVFSPDGRKIAYASDVVGGNRDIYVADASGANPVRLTFATSATTESFGPDWAPNGQRIVFQREDNANTELELFVMNANGSGQAPLTTNAVQDRAPKYSPDGKLIIWSQELGTIPASIDDAELFTMPAAGGAATRLTTNGIPDRGAAYSRDGVARIFWVQTDAPATDEEIFVMNGNGTGAVRFAGSTSEELSPAPQPVAACSKKKATIIGTDKSETLVGGPGPDVFAAFGGKDKIKGKGGKDTICGDAGNDNMIGGPGKDFLSGGKGKDKEAGGKGKDTCVGGKGEDSAKGCEKEKSL